MKRKPYKTTCWAIVDDTGTYFPEIIHTRKWARKLLAETQPQYIDATWRVARLRITEVKP
jgi:hypothetical protein